MRLSLRSVVLLGFSGSFPVAFLVYFCLTPCFHFRSRFRLHRSFSYLCPFFQVKCRFIVFLFVPFRTHFRFHFRFHPCFMSRSVLVFIFPFSFRLPFSFSCVCFILVSIFAFSSCFSFPFSFLFPFLVQLSFFIFRFHFCLNFLRSVLVFLFPFSFLFEFSRSVLVFIFRFHFCLNFCVQLSFSFSVFISV